MEYTVRELEKWNKIIEQKATELGLDYYPQEFEIIGFNEMIGYEAYVGMPSRYPHWSYGKAYEKNKTLYSFNLTGLPYEMVINSDPCLGYLMRENTLLLQILTMAHVYGHNDFFKNNRLFREGTKAYYTIEMFKLDADIIRDYINDPNIGYDKVEKILDAAHALRFQIPRVVGVKELTQEKYKYGFTTDVHTDIIERGLNEDVVRLISEKKGEPEWLLEFRLKAYRHWLTLEMPTWAHLRIPEIDYQAISYYADPTKKKEGPKSMDEVDPELIKTFNKLGIPLEEQMALSGMAVDAVMDSVSVKTTFKETLMEKGIIFCSFSEAVREHPDLVQKYLGSVVPYRDNFFAALNSAVFSDGSFVYIPKGVRCPMELSTYFRINARNTGQFERTLIVADDDSYVSYLEGCTAPMRDENQLHAAIVEIVVHDHAEVKYSTVQNWYPGDAEGRGGVYNFVTKRGHCKGVDSKLSWTQVETGSAITWKYPSCILSGDNSTAEFYSVAVTNNHQQADTGTKMIHLGKNTRSTIVSKGISAGKSENSYRGLVRVAQKADNARNYSQCDSLLLGDKCGAHTFPYMDIHNETAIVEHEATTSKISEDQIFYCNQRGISTEDAVGLIVNGYAKEVLNKLPMEFAVEAQKLLAISLEGSVG